MLGRVAAQCSRPQQCRRGEATAASLGYYSLGMKRIGSVSERLQTLLQEHFDEHRWDAELALQPPGDSAMSYLEQYADGDVDDDDMDAEYGGVAVARDKARGELVNLRALAAKRLLKARVMLDDIEQRIADNLAEWQKRYLD